MDYVRDLYIFGSFKRQLQGNVVPFWVPAWGAHPAHSSSTCDDPELPWWYDAAPMPRLPGLLHKGLGLENGLGWSLFWEESKHLQVFFFVSSFFVAADGWIRRSKVGCFMLFWEQFHDSQAKQWGRMQWQLEGWVINLGAGDGLCSYAAWPWARWECALLLEWPKDLAREDGRDNDIYKAECWLVHDCVLETCIYGRQMILPTVCFKKDLQGSFLKAVFPANDIYSAWRGLHVGLAYHTGEVQKQTLPSWERQGWCFATSPIVLVMPHAKEPGLAQELQQPGTTFCCVYYGLLFMGFPSGLSKAQLWFRPPFPFDGMPHYPWGVRGPSWYRAGAGSDGSAAGTGAGDVCK